MFDSRSSLEAADSANSTDDRSAIYQQMFADAYNKVQPIATDGCNPSARDPELRGYSALRDSEKVIPIQITDSKPLGTFLPEHVFRPADITTTGADRVTSKAWLGRNNELVELVETDGFERFNPRGDELSNVHSYRVDVDGTLLIKKNDGCGYQRTNLKNVRFDADSITVIASGENEEVHFKQGGKRIHLSMGVNGLIKADEVQNNGTKTAYITFPGNGALVGEPGQDLATQEFTLLTMQQWRKNGKYHDTTLAITDGNSKSAYFTATPGLPGYRVDVLDREMNELSTRFVRANLPDVAKYLASQRQLSIRFDQDHNFEIMVPNRTWKSNELDEMTKQRDRH